MTKELVTEKAIKHILRRTKIKLPLLIIWGWGGVRILHVPNKVAALKIVKKNLVKFERHKYFERQKSIQIWWESFNDEVLKNRFYDEIEKYVNGEVELENIKFL